MKSWVVRLEAEERARLEQLVRSGKASGLRIRHATILPAVDESEGSARLKDTEAASALGVAVRSIESLRKRFVEEGLAAALDRKKQLRHQRAFVGEGPPALGLGE